MTRQEHDQIVQAFRGLDSAQAGVLAAKAGVIAVEAPLKAALAGVPGLVQITGTNYGVQLNAKGDEIEIRAIGGAVTLESLVK